jgi:hypothetical protein
MKKTALILLLVSFFACKTTRETTKIGGRAQSETTLEASGQRETSSVSSGSFTQNTEATTDKETRLSGGSVQLSPPDSTGKQFPTVINWYNSNTAETSKITSDIKAMFEQKINSLENQILLLNEKLQTKTESETVSKTGFTFLEKTGMSAIGLLLLIIAYTVIKWYLKIKK